MAQEETFHSPKVEVVTKEIELAAVLGGILALMAFHAMLMSLAFSSLGTRPSHREALRVWYQD